MKIDKVKIRKFLTEIKRDTQEIEEFLKDDVTDKKVIKAIKYNLIEIVEAIANILQHILAREKGEATAGYLDTIEKAKEHKIISSSVYKGVKPFFKFRNILIHRYCITEDTMVVRNVRRNIKVFYKFIDEVEGHLSTF